MLSVQVEVTNMCQYIASGIKLKRGKWMIIQSLSSFFHQN
jgi:hypothetical protein